MKVMFGKELEDGDTYYELASHLMWLYNNSTRLGEHFIELDGDCVLHMVFKKDRWVCRVMKLEQVKVG